MSWVDHGRESSFWRSIQSVGAVPLPAYTDFRVIAEHEAVCRRLDGLTVDPNVLADEAVDDTVGEVANDAGLQDDAVLHLRVSNVHVIHD